MENQLEVVVSKLNKDKINVDGYLMMKNRMREDSGNPGFFNCCWHCPEKKNLNCKGTAETHNT